MKLSGPKERWFWLVGLTTIVAVAFLTRDRWLGPVATFVHSAIAARKAGHAAPHDEHSHGKEHGESSSLKLSEQARGNIGLTPEYLRPVSRQTFHRTIRVPGIVSERPGRTRVQVSTPMSGVITHVHAVQGEAVAPGTLLFEIRITAEALVSTQTDLLKTVGELEVENREIERLGRATESGAIPQKSLLERKYAKEKLEVLLEAQRESLRLLGLSSRQIDDITRNRKLLSELQITAPLPDDHSHEELKLTEGPVRPVTWRQPNPAARVPPLPMPREKLLVVQEVRVHKGQTVPSGATLGVMADYSELYIEGHAFEQDLPLLATAASKGWKVTAIIESAGGKTATTDGLDLIYSANEIEAESRTLPFYIRLPNEITKQFKEDGGQTFIQWKFRLGQRLQVLVPVEEWPDRIVLPVDAVAREGAEYFVFRPNGDHFDRVPVKVDYRDAASVVLANDGSVVEGDIIALRGAYQMLMALRNQSGGGIDPHAGHNH